MCSGPGTDSTYFATVAADVDAVAAEVAAVPFAADQDVQGRQHQVERTRIYDQYHVWMAG